MEPSQSSFKELQAQPGENKRFSVIASYSAFFRCERKSLSPAVHLSNLDAQNLALDLGKVERIVVPNQPNAVRPVRTVD